MSKLTLLSDEISTIQSVVKKLTKTYSSAEEPHFLQNSSYHASEMPSRVRLFLNDFKYNETHPPYALISGYPIDDSLIGNTPEHWKYKSDAATTLEQQILLVLYGSMLGEVFGWSTQQDGYIVHDVSPIKGHEKEQLGSGSEELLTWHTEDAFHPYRGDYLGLFCLRNPYQAITTLGSIVPADLSNKTLQILFEPRFTIRPDESHLEKNKSGLRQEVGREKDTFATSVYDKIDEMNTRPEKIAVLFGDFKSPYMRLDPYFMDYLADDPEAQEALDALIKCIDNHLVDLILQPGDCIIIDNYRAVHGRKPLRHATMDMIAGSSE